MRRALGYFLAFTLILIALGALFGTRLLEQTLDAELPGLLVVNWVLTSASPR